MLLTLIGSPRRRAAGANRSRLIIRHAAAGDQKRTLLRIQSMSALPQKADIANCDRHVRFVPIADIRHLIRSPRRRLQSRRVGM